MTAASPSRSRRRPRRRWTVGITLTTTLSTLAATALTGCTTSPPSPPEVPDILWVTDEPTGPLEADEWVQTARAYELLSSVAWNAGDYTDPALARVTAPLLIQEHGRRRKAEAGRSEGQILMAGPTPFTPASVKASTSGDRAVVTGCWVEGWFLDAETSAPQVSGGREVQYELKRDDHDNPQVVDAYSKATTCDPTDIPRAVFAPAPEIPTHWPDPDDIRIPNYKP